MEAAGLTDPSKRQTPSTIASNGECFSLKVDGHEGVFVVEKQGGVLWIAGAGAMKSKGLTATGLQVIEQLARQSDCQRVSFQTGRRGLARLAGKQGYRVVGVIMEKSV